MKACHLQNYSRVVKSFNSLMTYSKTNEVPLGAQRTLIKAWIKSELR